MLIFLFNKLPHSSELCGESRKVKSFNNRRSESLTAHRKKIIANCFYAWSFYLPLTYGNLDHKSHHRNAAHYFMELLHFLCFLYVRPLKTKKAWEMQHFRKPWKILKSAFIGLLSMSCLHSMALWGVQTINSTYVCISSHFKHQDQSSASQGLYWAADYIIKMLSVKQGPVSPSTLYI